MGGRSARRKQKRANNLQQKANALNQAKIDEQEEKSRFLSKGLEYNNLMNEQVGGAKSEAMKGVTTQRAKSITDSTSLLTNYQEQERRRLFTAKTGKGQTDATDTAITGDMVEDAKTLLGRGADYWSNKRELAGQAAYDKEMKKFIGKYGTKEAYSKKR